MKRKEIFKSQISARVSADELELLNATVNRLPVIGDVNSQHDGIIAFATFLNTFLDKVDEMQAVEKAVKAAPVARPKGTNCLD
jgi:hypothetical protein